MGFAVTVGSQVLATNWAPFSPPPSLNRGWVKRQHEITSLLCNLVKSTSLTPPWGFDSALQCNNVLHSTCFVMLSRGLFKTMQEEDTEQQSYISYCKMVLYWNTFLAQWGALSRSTPRTDISILSEYFHPYLSIKMPCRAIYYIVLHWAGVLQPLWCCWR